MSNVPYSVKVLGLNPESDWGAFCVQLSSRHLRLSRAAKQEEWWMFGWVEGPQSRSRHQVRAFINRSQFKVTLHTRFNCPVWVISCSLISLKCLSETLVLLLRRRRKHMVCTFTGFLTRSWKTWKSFVTGFPVTDIRPNIVNNKHTARCSEHEYQYELHEWTSSGNNNSIVVVAQPQYARLVWPHSEFGFIMKQIWVNRE